MVPATINTDVAIAAARDLGGPIANAISSLVNGYVEIAKSNNSTKVALAKIDADLTKALAQIRTKGDNMGKMIELSGIVLKAELEKTSLSEEYRSELFNKWVSRCFDSIDRM